MPEPKNDILLALLRESPHRGVGKRPEAASAATGIWQLD
jgi:hypothetical protein